MLSHCYLHNIFSNTGTEASMFKNVEQSKEVQGFSCDLKQNVSGLNFLSDYEVLHFKKKLPFFYSC